MPNRPEANRLNRLRKNNGLNWFKGLRRTEAAQEKQVALGKLGLYRCDVDRLQKLGLQELTGPSDSMPRQRGVRVRKEPVRGVIGGIIT